MFFGNLIAKSSAISFNFIDAGVTAALGEGLLEGVTVTRSLALFARVGGSMGVSLLAQDWRMAGS